MLISAISNLFQQRGNKTFINYSNYKNEIYFTTDKKLKLNINFDDATCCKILKLFKDILIVIEQVGIIEQ